MGLLLAGLAGCDYYDLVDAYWCDHPDKGHKGPDGQPDPCHRQDADGGTDPGAEPSCDVGAYAHWRLPWEPPTMLWFGPPDQAPECPRGPATISYEGYADLVAPSTCEACTCDPPTGSCALPSKITASTAVCGAQGASTSFDAPASWDGSCDSTTQTPDGAAHSLSIDSITMTENGCASGPPVAAKVLSLRWDTFARGCDVGLPGGQPSAQSASQMSQSCLGSKPASLPTTKLTAPMMTRRTCSPSGTSSGAGCRTIVSAHRAPVGRRREVHVRRCSRSTRAPILRAAVRHLRRTLSAQRSLYA